jgi:hypothetical protein
MMPGTGAILQKFKHTAFLRTAKKRSEFFAETRNLNFQTRRTLEIGEDLWQLDRNFF